MRASGDGLLKSVAGEMRESRVSRDRPEPLPKHRVALTDTDRLEEPPKRALVGAGRHLQLCQVAKGEVFELKRWAVRP